MVVSILLTAVIAYLLGNLNGAIVTSRLIAHEDVRAKGSGNAGLTNFVRNYGGHTSVFVIAIDMGKAVAGWASMTCILCFVSGVQLTCMGVIGEYIGKIYMESKHRPRYIISERTWQ